MPAFATTMSMLPSSATVRATAPSTASRLATSHSSTSARRPAASTAWATGATSYGSPAKYASATSAPASANVVAVAAPMPDAAPVTNATLPSRRNTRALYSSVIVAAVSTDAAERLEGDFTLSLRVEVPADRAGAAGGLAAKFDPASRTGFSLSAISSAGGYNGPGDELRLSFGIDAGTEPRWFDRGRPSPTSNYVSNSLTVFDGALHAATSDAPAAADRGHVYRHLGGTEWQDLGQVGREGAHGVGPLIVHRGALFAATWNYDWTRVHDEDLAPCHVYRYEAPGRWQDCGQPGDARRIFSLASYRGDLLAMGDDSTVHAHRGEGRWELVQRFDTFAHPATVHDGRLVLGMLQPATVHAFDGSDWDDLGNPLGDPARCDEIHTLATLPRRAARGHLAARPRRPLGRRAAGAGGRPAGSATAPRSWR